MLKVQCPVLHRAFLLKTAINFTVRLSDTSAVMWPITMTCGVSWWFNQLVVYMWQSWWPSTGQSAPGNLRLSWLLDVCLTHTEHAHSQQVTKVFTSQHGNTNSNQPASSVFTSTLIGCVPTEQASPGGVLSWKEEQQLWLGSVGCPVCLLQLMF